MIRVFFGVILVILGWPVGAQPNSNGPWNNPLMMATSQDGTTFSDPIFFQDSAGVPSMAKVSPNHFIAAFQWFPMPFRGRHWDSVAVKFSSDDGMTWGVPKPISVTGLPTNFQRPFDPAITVTEDGKFRLYFSSGMVGSTGGLTPQVDTYSALSSDGINYVFEPNARFDQASKIVIDPTVILFDGRWHLAAPKGAPQEGAYHAVSDDGLIFDPLPDISSDNQHNWTGNMMMEGPSVVRFYGSGPKVWWSASSDLVAWSAYTATNVSGGDPAVMRREDGSYLMIYVGPKKLVTGGLELSSIPHVYPNPAADVLYISTNQIVEDIDFKLMDAYGTVVASTRITQSESKMDVRELPVGVYVVCFMGGSMLLYTQRVCIVR